VAGWYFAVACRCDRAINLERTLAPAVGLRVSRVSTFPIGHSSRCIFLVVYCFPLDELSWQRGDGNMLFCVRGTFEEIVGAQSLRSCLFTALRNPESTLLWFSPGYLRRYYKQAVDFSEGVRASEHPTSGRN
jgi:hypothetical protein